MYIYVYIYIYIFSDYKKSSFQNGSSKFKSLFILNGTLCLRISTYEIRKKKHLYYKSLIFVLKNCTNHGIKITCSRHACVE